MMIKSIKNIKIKLSDYICSKRLKSLSQNCKTHANGMMNI